jgi:hypothetical protein
VLNTTIDDALVNFHVACFSYQELKIPDSLTGLEHSYFPDFIQLVSDNTKAHEQKFLTHENASFNSDLKTADTRDQKIDHAYEPTMPKLFRLNKLFGKIKIGCFGIHHYLSSAIGMACKRKSSTAHQKKVHFRCNNTVGPSSKFLSNYRIEGDLYLTAVIIKNGLHTSENNTVKLGCRTTHSISYIQGVNDCLFQEPYLSLVIIPMEMSR